MTDVMPDWGEREFVDDEYIPWDVDNGAAGDADTQDLVSEEDDDE